MRINNKIVNEYEIITTVNCTEKIRKGNFKQMELKMDIVNPFPI